MTAFDSEALAAAKEELLRIPGVHAVSVGFRLRDGTITNERVLTALVWRKRPLAEISESEVIPREIRGIPIDVLEADAPRRLQYNFGPNIDQSAAQPPLSVVPFFDHLEYAQIRGGLACEGAGSGTIGCIARATDSTNNGKLVVLTNRHVLASKGSGEGSSLYQPESSCCCCGRKIGKTLRTRVTTTHDLYTRNPTTTSIDAGIVLLNPGLQCLAEIQIGAGPGTTTQLVRGVITAAELPTLINVQKRGARTGLTNGLLFDPAFDRDSTDGDKGLAYRRQLLIAPTFPSASTNATFRFDIGGDSGSVVMTQDDDRVVGLLWGALVARVPARNLTIVMGLATDILTVSSQMQISIETTTTANQVITVPATNVVAASASSGAPAVPAHTRMMLEQARAQIEATEYGRMYAETIRRHHAEVWNLVRTNRKVGAIWKRYGGQAILQAVLDAIGRPDAPIPAAVASRPLADSAARIAAVLQRYGSAALARDAAAYRPLVSGLSGNSYNQLLARLRMGEAL